jgi:hypothetical protein
VTPGNAKENTMRQPHAAIDRTANAEVDAYNAAFDELGLEWHWDRATLAELAAIAGDKARVRAYVTRHHPHLLTAYDADFIGELVAKTKAEQAGRPASAGGSAAAQHRAAA